MKFPRLEKMSVVTGMPETPAQPLSRREALALERAQAGQARPVPQPSRPQAEHAQVAAHSAKVPKQQPAPAKASKQVYPAMQWKPRREQSLAEVQSTPAPAAVRSPIRWARGLAGVGLVAGLFATVALPAYSLSADGEVFASSDMFSSSQQNAQTVDVSGEAAGQSTTTDGYSSESAAQLSAARIQAIRSSSSYVPAYQSAGDDYPFWNQATEYSGGGLSPLGYYYRECVDFVAWRLNRDVGSTSAPWRYTWHNLASGSAYMWYSAWTSHGWPTSSTPVSGAVAWFPYNHVAYVKSVNADGSVNIEEYNQQSDHMYHTRTIAASDAVYLYPPG